MRTTGIITQITPVKDHLELTLSCAISDPSLIKDYEDESIWITLIKASEKKSDLQRRYYWELIDMLAKALGIGNAECHNRMLREYGVIADFDGFNIFTDLPDTPEWDNKVLKDTKNHLMPTSKVNGGMRQYVLLKSSSLYTSREMNRLINGVISECTDLGLETRSKEEIERIESLCRK